MDLLNVREADIRESFVLASGPGGQNVNKTATCVYLVHRPTGLSVKCQKERSQEQNRIQARWILCNKIQAQQQAAKNERIARLEKIRRQKRKRSVSGKEAMLDNKRRRSQAKGLRRRVDLRRQENW